MIRTDRIEVVDPMARSVGKRLLEARERLGLTRADLADRTGISANMLYRVENDQRNLTLESATRLCDALGMTLDELAGRKALKSATTPGRARR